MINPFKKVIHHLTLNQELVALGFVVLAALLIGSAWYGYMQLTSLKSQVAQLDSELTSTMNLFKNNLAEATTSLSSALQEQKQALGGVEERVGDIDGTVTDLQKLSKIDPELLTKYSKVFFLSENYVPAELISIPKEYRYNEQTELKILPQVLPFLKRMLNEARDDEVEIYVQSAYRSFSTQSALKNQYTFLYGAGTANQFSADQGYSEHQLGTTVDFITKGLGGQLEGFEKTPAYMWLTENAHRYGFVLSYPKENDYYIFEPWHWRFVGDKLSRDLHSSGEYFYGMDQRTIDTYLISLFD